ncbi:hypothetical protein SNE40_023666 [Patella caerulea]|uniref:Reverse transcriptase domain-containing protein n=1 Tax=Patella caerulea TaxID=87958 RepID=A0AAN8IVC2_PATCE
MPCSWQLLNALECWIDMLEESKPLDCVFFDFKKAFNMVPHRRLFAQVEMYGISDNVLAWVRNYLPNRSQVAENGRLSQPTAACSGFPQGSIIGPMLFLIIINDLPALAANFVKLFTDNTERFGDANSDSIQQDIQTFEDWATEWCVTFRPDNCKVMRLGKGHHPYEYIMHNEYTIRRKW